MRKRTRGAISVYAQGDDYHEVIKPRLKALARWLIAQAGGDVKVFVDTAAVMEKPLAQRAGLGWQGKHTNLVSREFGSWLFLGAIFTTLELPRTEAEIDHCGSCRACLDVCPTAPFPRPTSSIRAAASPISPSSTRGRSRANCARRWATASMAATIASRSVPWNKFAQAGPRGEAAARETLQAPALADLATLDDAHSARCFAKSPVKRTGRDRFVRNVLIAIGNSGDRSLARMRKRHAADDDSPLVRGAAVWALSRLLPQGIRCAAMAQSTVAVETDTEVVARMGCCDPSAYCVAIAV